MAQQAGSRKAKHVFFVVVLLVTIVLSITVILSTAGRLSSELATDIGIISGLASVVATVVPLIYSASHSPGGSPQAAGGKDRTTGPLPTYPGKGPKPKNRGQKAQSNRAPGQVKRMAVMVMAVVLCVLMLEGVFFGILQVVNRKNALPQVHVHTYPCNFAPTAAAINAQGIGAQPEPGGAACMGISDGALTAFDFSEQGRPRGYSAFKRQVMALLAEGRYDDAVHLWKTSLQRAPNDAETQIYLLNQQIIANKSPYITLVVTTIFPLKLGGSRDILQGVYVLQQEALTSCVIKGCLRLRLLIANAGDVPSDAITVSQQIIQAAQHDKTIKGVIGWPYSSYAVQATNVLGQAGLPMISPTASDDSLSGQSPYFFRIPGRNSQQAHVAARYAAQQLGARRIVVFYDPADAYSNSLARDFWQDGTVANDVVDKENYTTRDAASLQQAWNRAKNYSPDLVYFAGYPEDVSLLPVDFPPCPDASSPSCLKLLGGDALYVLGNYTQANHINYNRLRFTAFAFPDEWLSVGFGNPPFFSDYAIDLDPDRLHPGAYGWERPDADTMLAYDAVGVALYGYKLSQDDRVSLQQGLASITGTRACQGITGRIDFHNGDVPDKAVVMLTVDALGHTQMAPIGDQFYKDQLSYNLPFCL